MNVIQILEEAKDWLDKEVCKEISLKRPPDSGGVDAEDYNYQLVHPKAFIMYPPLTEKFPSVTVQFGKGNENKNKHSGEIELRFLFGSWDPGFHYTEAGHTLGFKENNNGWKDVWNFIDIARRKLKNTNSIGKHLRIKHENEIQFGPMSERDVIANYYPHWCGWIAITVQYGTTSTNKDLQNLV